MKKAIALSCACFLISVSLVSCGNKDKNDTTVQDNNKTTTTSEVTTARTTTAETTSRTTGTSYTTSRRATTDMNGGDVSEHGVMPDADSPLEAIPDAIGTAAEGVGDAVSEVIDDLT
ncbi:MAG: hypothetical protein E7505_02960 [Ruminococcus sp.]|jgi:hypothetical protein|nr:hypothetical protein [Ruminococcus sp.]